MNNSEPSDKTTKVPPVSSSPSATLNMEQAPPLVFVPSPEVNMIDGFQIVEKKSDKKRRRKTENTEAHIVKTNKANTPPVTPIPTAPPTLAETNPTAVVNKIFKEIDDGYYLEVLPANKGNMITIPIEHTNDLCLSVPSGRPRCGNVNSIISDAEADDLDWKKDFPRSKRRGRPPGSKNKSPSGIGGDEASLQNSIKYTSGSSDLNSVPTENNLG
ncbi:hypothetical protein SUGI_1199890 [Cryptomeria japonica]|nr:hypothetical protein SUGI_1199890 [Cryptomeria japonica]